METSDDTNPASKWLPVTPSTRKAVKAVYDTSYFRNGMDNSSIGPYMNPNPMSFILYGRQCQRQIQGYGYYQGQERKTKIYTIGFPAGAKGPLEEIAAMTGGKSKFVIWTKFRPWKKRRKNPLTTIQKSTLLVFFAIFLHSVRKKTPIRVLLIDGQNNHSWKSTTRSYRALQMRAFEVSVSTTPPKNQARRLKNWSPAFRISRPEQLQR